MSKQIFHTDQEQIPAFGIITYTNGQESEIEFFNQRTGATESYPVTEFIMRLIKMIMAA